MKTLTFVFSLVLGIASSLTAIAQDGPNYVNPKMNGHQAEVKLALDPALFDTDAKYKSVLQALGYPEARNENLVEKLKVTFWDTPAATLHNRGIYLRSRDYKHDGTVESLKEHRDELTLKFRGIQLTDVTDQMRNLKHAKIETDFGEKGVLSYSAKVRMSKQQMLDEAERIGDKKLHKAMPAIPPSDLLSSDLQGLIADRMGPDFRLESLVPVGPAKSHSWSTTLNGKEYDVEVWIFQSGRRTIELSAKTTIEEMERTRQELGKDVLSVNLQATKTPQFKTSILFDESFPKLKLRCLSVF